MSIVATRVGKSLGEPPTKILQDIELEIKNGEFVSLTGRSGSGKSTLLYLLSSLDAPTSGSVQVDGADVNHLNNVELCRFRNEKLGFVFQFHYLLAELTALENILMPAKKAGREQERRAYAQQLLEKFGLGSKGGRLPRQLSGGEQQRVAIARSLVMEPKYLFADEPTGSLDSANSETVMNIFHEANRNGTTIVLVTHDPDYAKMAHRQIHLADGRIVDGQRA
jgi:lipoprotein-releasing system ATP-binding protein